MRLRPEIVVSAFRLRYALHGGEAPPTAEAVAACAEHVKAHVKAARQLALSSEQAAPPSEEFCCGVTSG
jgi:hypothetical protein